MEATMKTDTAFSGLLCGHAVLIIETDLSAATDLQDALAETGARIWTAYTFERAYLHAEKSHLSAAIINGTIPPLEKKMLSDLLSKRNVPYVVSSNGSSYPTGRPSISPMATVERIVTLVRSSGDSGGLENVLAGTRKASMASNLFGQSR
jgi:hypothetical protein